MGEATERKHITIFTGNSCQNPGRGGYGVVLAWSDGDYHKELSGGFSYTSTYRLAYWAIVVALEALREPCEVMAYLPEKGIGMMVQRGELETLAARYGPGPDPWPNSNGDLLQRLYTGLGRHTVTIEWGTRKPKHRVLAPEIIHELEIAARLAQKAMQALELPPDPGYHPS
jgi:ribonuclease HI